MYKSPRYSRKLIVLSFSLCLANLGTSNAGNFIINEILFNPTSSDAGKEWIELINPSNETTNISEWTISNRTGIAIVSLPNWNVPGNAYLLVHFGNGTNDSNFTDGSGHFYSNHTEEVFNNSKDECGLFNSTPGNSSIIDFISWSSDGSASNGEAYRYALEGGRWISGEYLNINWTENKVSDDESIGRDRNSTDTDKAADWSSHGGKDAYFATPGWPNGGPLFSVNDGIFFTQAQANSVLIHYGFNITYSNHSFIRKSETDNDIFVNASHHFVTSYDNNTVLFSGFGVFHWNRTDLSSSMTKINLDLYSNYGELVTINYSSEEKILDNKSRNITQKVDAIYSVQKSNDSYQSESYMHLRLLNASCLQKDILQQIIDNTIIKTKKSTEIDVIHSFNHTESWLDGSESQNIGNNTSISMHSNTYFNPDDINEYKSVIDKYFVKEDTGINYSLVEKGYFRSNRTASNLYNSSWEFSLKNNLGNYTNISGRGYHEYGSSGKGLVLLGNVTYDINGIQQKTKQYYIDDFEVIYDLPLLTQAKIAARANMAAWGIAAASEIGSEIVVGVEEGWAALGTAAKGISVGLLVWWTVEEAIKCKEWRKYVKPVIFVEEISDKPGEICFRLRAFSTKEGIGIKDENKLLEPKCFNNTKCNDDYKLKAYTATDGNDISSTIYIKIRIRGKLCDDNNPCTIDSCSPDGKCKNKFKCGKRTCYQNWKTGDCCCSNPDCDENGECFYVEDCIPCDCTGFCAVPKCSENGLCSCEDIGRENKCDDQGSSPLDQDSYSNCISLGGSR